LRLAAAYILSPEALREIAQSLAAGEPSLLGIEAEGASYELASADGSWNLRLAPEIFSLQTSGSQTEKVLDPLRHVLAWLLTDRAGLSFERVALAYFSAAPIEGQRFQDLFTESVIDLIAGQEEAFTQALSGTWHRGHYTLHYGVGPLAERTLYQSDAWVSALNVQAPELDAVLWDLDEEGLRLLSWPITRQAAELLDVQEDLSEHLLPSLRQLFPPSGMSAIDQVNRERFELLARKHGRTGFSAEDERRLEEVTETVRLLLPRTLHSDWQIADDLADRLDRIQGRTLSIRKKYGLSG
jgi:hypothetical protein